MGAIVALAGFLLALVAVIGLAIWVSTSSPVDWFLRRLITVFETKIVNPILKQSPAHFVGLVGLLAFGIILVAIGAHYV